MKKTGYQIDRDKLRADMDRLTNLTTIRPFERTAFNKQFLKDMQVMRDSHQASINDFRKTMEDLRASIGNMRFTNTRENNRHQDELTFRSHVFHLSFIGTFVIGAGVTLWLVLT